MRAPNTDGRIRPIAPADVDAVVAMVYDLAMYEKMSDQCHLRPEALRAALFCANPAVFGLVSLADDGSVVGYALYFLNFSTWEGVHGIYLEDLYVRPEQRGAGLGTAMLSRLARTAVQRGYARVEWWVLDWNAPSIDFYASLGAEPMNDWTVFRLTGAALRRTAGEIG